jgi:hypothetical protein
MEASSEIEKSAPAALTDQIFNLWRLLPLDAGTPGSGRLLIAQKPPYVGGLDALSEE